MNNQGIELIEIRVDNIESTQNGHRKTLYGEDGLGGVVMSLQKKAGIGLFWCIFGTVLSSIAFLGVTVFAKAEKSDLEDLKDMHYESIKTQTELNGKMDKILGVWEVKDKQNAKDHKALKDSIEKIEKKIEK